MYYNDFKALKISALGMGGMRFAVTDGNYSAIDQANLDAMVDYAMAQGINYFDTAWGYHEGNSEIALGKSLARYPRDRFYLADKFPGYDLANMGKVREIFPKQLEKCGVDYFDFYLFHNVTEANLEEYLNPANGIFDYLIEQKKQGKIKHLGFSTHGNIHTVTRFLDAYGEAMEFCQIQLNWLDFKLQDAKAKLELLRQRKLPVIVMEPLRGGALVKLDPAQETVLKQLRPEDGAVEWAFRYLQTFPEVITTLSGMGNMEELTQNIRVYETRQPLSQEELTALYGTVDTLTASATLPCTACRYCTDYCPQKLDIPHLISLFNEYNYAGGWQVPAAIRAMKEEQRPSACIACGGCEAVCPQNIKVSQMMQTFTEKLNKRKKGD